MPRKPSRVKATSAKLAPAAQPDKPDTSYNGWTNYETWAVKLWLDNDEATYSETNRLARTIARRGPIPIPGTGIDREVRFVLADHLKEWVEGMMPDMGATMWADLLNAAFSEVNWTEIAENLLTDIG